MKMEKYRLWLMFFFLIFGLSFSMIIWTIRSTAKADLSEDKSFLSTYHDVDSNFNTMMISNERFNAMYDISFDVNNRAFPLELKDIFLAQRALKDKSNNQEMFNLGINNISVKIIDKKSGKVIDNALITLQISKAIKSDADINLKNIPFKDGVYLSQFNIKDKGNWNINGEVSVGVDKGYLFIKTNTKE